MAQALPPLDHPTPPPAALALAQRLTARPAAEVEDILEGVMRSPVELIPEVSHHLIGAGGKRVRPLLLLLCEQACGGAGRGVPLAAAAELIHSATLLHDDVVDRGHLRRGVAAAPRVFGNSASVLVGDYLLARAYDLVIRNASRDLLLELSRVLSGMAEGEILQLVRSGRATLSQTEYVRIISGKTAGLFSWCARAGASLGTLAPVEAAAAFGLAFGMAFQIGDDILDCVADPAQSGKDLANDLVQGKITLPLLLACEEDAALLPRVEDAARHPDEEAARAILQSMFATRAIVRARQEVARYTDEAREYLLRLPATPEREALEALARFLVERV
ncbi:MAG: polyprenyl synthetase family protein [Myxococcales bacterium]|nr:polyprenyl synthetase family protein [Myxococcales bacterium]